MNKKLSLFGLAVVCSLVLACRSNKFPVSEQLVYATLWFQKSDEMKVLFTQAYDRALEQLMENRLRYTAPNPAVILDIDETVLDNSPYEARLVKIGETYTSENWGKWVEEANAKALPGALEFTRKALSSGVEVYYISNRSAKHLQPTIENLKKEGFPNADAEHVLLKTTSSDKTERRESVKAGHKVLLLIGDQLGDFAEEYTLDSDTLMQHFIMLPNPMYGGFEKKAYEGSTDLDEYQKARKRREVLRTE